MTSISVDAQRFKAATERISCVGGGVELPSSEHVLISITGGHMSLRFSGIHMTAEARGIPVEGTSEHVEFGVDRTILVRMAAAITSDKVFFTISDKSIGVAFGSAKLELPTLGADLFPPLPRRTDLTKVSAEKLLSAVAAVMPCSGGIGYRGCVVFDGANVVATTGYRLGSFVSDKFSDDLIIISRESAKELPSILRTATDICVGADDFTVYVEATTATGDVLLSLRRSSLKYPNYKSAVPSDAPLLSLSINTGVLMQSVTHAMLTAMPKKKQGASDGGLSVLDIDFLEDSLKLSSRTDGGKSSESVVGCKSGAHPRVSLDGGCLSSALRFVPDETVNIEFRGQEKPVAIRSSNGFQLIVPIRS
jgi:DNA polymerase III sliding clamp (beta) subunit (PCNA family)